MVFLPSEIVVLEAADAFCNCSSVAALPIVANVGSFKSVLERPVIVPVLPSITISLASEEIVTVLPLIVVVVASLTPFLL